MAELFAVTRENITMHLKNIYESDELREEATRKDFLQVRQEGARQVSRMAAHYNLDAIISVDDAQQHAWSEFERFRIAQDHLHVSDFDRLMADYQITTNAELIIRSEALDDMISETQDALRKDTHGDPT